MSSFTATAPVQTTAGDPVINRTRPLLRVTRPSQAKYLWIHKGKQGSLQTAAEMANLVREDAVRDEGLERWAAQIVINSGLDSHSPPAEVVDAIFRYVQGLSYIHDPAGSFDSIQSARQTILKGYGDCDDLSVLLATLLALVGFRPAFTMARYAAGSSRKGFDHVYVSVNLPQGRTPLDPSSRTQGMGWESPRAIEKLDFPIFAGRITSLGDALQSAGMAVSGLGQLPPGVGQGLSTLLASVLAKIGSGGSGAQYSDARDTWKEQVYQGMTQVQAAVDQCQITPQEGVAAAQQIIARYYADCDQNMPPSIAQSCRNFESPYGGFATRRGWIAGAGKNCQTGSGGQAAGSGSAAGVAAPGLSLPVVVLIGVGVFLILRMR